MIAENLVISLNKKKESDKKSDSFPEENKMDGAERMWVMICFFVAIVISIGIAAGTWASNKQREQVLQADSCEKAVLLNGGTEQIINNRLMLCAVGRANKALKGIK